jgi:hypothetical protein
VEEVIVGRLEGATIPSAHPAVTCNIPGMAAWAQSLVAGCRYPKIMIEPAQRELDGFVSLLQSLGIVAAGRPADALGHLDRAIAGIDEAGIGIYLPEIYRLRGACLLALDRGNKAGTISLRNRRRNCQAPGCGHFRASRGGVPVRVCDMETTGLRLLSMPEMFGGGPL